MFKWYELSDKQILGDFYRGSFYNGWLAFNNHPISNGYNSMLPRYAQKFNQEAIIPQDLFTNHLGIDVAHRTHPIQQARIIFDLAIDEPEQVTAKRLHDFVLTAVVHDFPECLPNIGDVPYGSKTDNHENLEHQALPDLLKIAFPEEHKQYWEIVEPILFGDQVKGSDAELFNLSEKVGYLTTGLRAHHNSQPHVNNAAYGQIYSAIARETATRTIEALTLSAMDHPGIKKFLDLHEKYFVAMLG